MAKENMTTFNSPQMLKRYPDGSLRIVTYNKLVVGSEVSFKNERWIDEKGVVSEIDSADKSMGDFGVHNTPTSYRLKIKPIQTTEDAK